MMTKKRLLILFVLCCSFFTSFAQVRMRDVFAKMPEEVLLFVTENNRLDCIDFIENNMQARVKNRFDENIELKRLTDDYLLFQTSEVGQMEMKLLERTDSTAIICVVETVMGPLADSSIRFFDQSWKSVTSYDGKVSRPSVEAFFANVPEDKRSDIDNALSELRDLPLMEARLSPDDNSLTWTLSVAELSKDVKKAAQECVQPVVVLLIQE